MCLCVGMGVGAWCVCVCVCVCVRCAPLKVARADEITSSDILLKKADDSPKTESNRAQNTANDFGVFWFFFSNIFLWALWVLIIPKWPFKVPVHIPILFGSFLELPQFHQIWILGPLIYYGNTLKI